MTVERIKKILTAYIGNDLHESGLDWVKETLSQICTQEELKELDMWEWLEFDDYYIITAKCSCCGYEEEYHMDDDEYKNLEKYYDQGNRAGKLQNLFPKMPAWIRSSFARGSGGFCICPKCN